MRWSFSLAATALAPALALSLAADARPASAQDAPGCFLARGTLEEAAQRPSPLDSATVRIGGAEVKVCYGAPSARDREVMGELVPFDAPWRAGANEATTIRTAGPIEVGGVRLQPGSYSLYAVPSADSWEIVLNSNPDRWGIPINEGVRADDIGSFRVTPQSTDNMIERLSFRFAPRNDHQADLVMEWENTRIRIPVSHAME